MNDELIGLPSIKEYCEKAQKLKNEYLEMKEVFERKEREYNSFFQREFPKVLYELGLKECTLNDGTRVVLRQKASLSLTTKENRENVFAFLEKNNGEMLLSESIIVDPIYKDSLSVPYEVTRSGNTNTIKSFLLSGIREGRFSLPDRFPMKVWEQCEVIE